MQVHSNKTEITPEDLAKLGANSIAYIRRRTVDNRKVWFIYGAEGTELAYTDDENKAISMVFDNKLIPVSVH